jgi:hypothetical protein
MNNTAKVLATRERGSVIIFGMVLVTLLATLSISFAMRIQTNEVRLEADIAGTQALELARNVTTLKMQEMWLAYRTAMTHRRVKCLGGIAQAGTYATDCKPARDFDDAEQWINYGPGQAKCVIEPAGVNGVTSIDIRIMTLARVPSALGGRMVSRRLERVVRYDMAQSDVFNFVYFANNFGWMWGTPLYLYGGMGANGNLNFGGNPTVSGQLFAANNPALASKPKGYVTGVAPRVDTVTEYKTLGASNPYLKPTNPTSAPEDLNGNGSLEPGEDANGNGTLDDNYWEPGYGGVEKLKGTYVDASGKTVNDFQIGNKDAKLGQQTKEMPYLGDFLMYRDLSAETKRPIRPEIGETTGAAGGIVKQLKAPDLDPTDPNNYNILVDQTYGYKAGETGQYAEVQDDGSVKMVKIAAKLDDSNNAPNGNLALVGTPKQPIIILGPVVISNDLVIKGTVKGQGTFYVGRNTHIIGDVTYSDPPKWKQDDLAFATTAEDNIHKDGVGFGTRGNVILGDYTKTKQSGGDGSDSWDYATWFMTNDFTKPYSADAADADIGYGNTTSTTFQADYTKEDGGKRLGSLDADDADGDGKADDDKVGKRLYFESSFPASYIRSLSMEQKKDASGKIVIDTTTGKPVLVVAKPKKIHGIFYTNHFFGGRVENMEMYGSMVTRDEGIVTSGFAKWYYDPRLSKSDSSTYINLFLPKTPLFQVLLEREMPAEDDSMIESAAP